MNKGFRNRESNQILANFRAEEQAQELKHLQGQLADYNLVIGFFWFIFCPKFEDNWPTKHQFQCARIGKWSGTGDSGKSRQLAGISENWNFRIDCGRRGDVQRAQTARRACARIGTASGTVAGTKQWTNEYYGRLILTCYHSGLAIRLTNSIFYCFKGTWVESRIWRSQRWSRIPSCGIGEEAVRIGGVGKAKRGNGFGFG